MAEKLGEVEGKGHHWGHQSIFSFQDLFTLSYKYLPGPAEDKELNKYRVFFLTAPPPEFAKCWPVGNWFQKTLES